MTIAALAILTIVVTIFLVKVLPRRGAGGTLVLHYNVYLGIDEVHDWYWIFLLPGVWLILTLADLFLAYGFYRKDKHLALSLILLAFFWGFPWTATLFYLSLANV